MLARLNTMRTARRSRSAFSLVEILIVILIIAVLMAVAIPNLLSSRDSGTDSAAKQLLSRAQTEIQSYTLRTELPPKAVSANDATASGDKIITSIKFIDDPASSGVVAGTNARSVSYWTNGTTEFKIAARGSQNNCWAIWVQATKTQYAGALNVTTCSPSNIPAASWQDFGYPTSAK